MSEELLGRLDELMKEVRRQGRAAIAAQAAAEQCLTELAARAAPMPTREDDAERWLRALLPVIDAVDRLASGAVAMAAKEPTRLPWPFRRGDLHAEVGRLAEGLQVLRAQLRAALESVGVERVDPTGKPFDDSLHRAVASRPGRPAVVLEVLRSGYLLDERVVREAEVVVGRAREES